MSTGAPLTPEDLDRIEKVAELGELEQYQLGVEMGKRIGRLEGLNEALQIVRDYSPGEEGLSPAEFSRKYGTCDLEFAILKRRKEQP